MKDKKNPEIVVVGKNYCTSLGVIRAMGIAGYGVEVIRLVERMPKVLTPDLKSKYVVRYEYALSDNEESVLKVLLERIADVSYKKLIIPTDDFCASLLDRNMERLKGFFIVPNAKGIPGGLTRCMDKSVQKELAKRKGLHAAKGWTIEISVDGKFQIPDSLVYPCYTKPQVSVGSPKSYIKKCNDIVELQNVMKGIAKHGKNVILVEEYLEIDNEYVVPGVACAGTAVIPAVIRKTKIGSGEHKGVTAMGQVLDADGMPLIKHTLSQLFLDIDLTGLFDVELIESKGLLYFNELNLRNGAAGFAVTVSGVNLPAILANYALRGLEPAMGLKVVSGRTFVSEKVQLEDYQAGCISWKEYKEQIEKSDFRFIDWKEDQNPVKAFEIIIIKTRIKQMIRKIKETICSFHSVC